jgi:hypothetical protein
LPRNLSILEALHAAFVVLDSISLHTPDGRLLSMN